MAIRYDYLVLQRITTTEDMGEGSVPRKPHSFLHAQLLCCILLFVTLWTVAHQAPLSMGLFKQEYWSGLLCPPPGDLPNPGIEPTSPAVPPLQVDSFLLSPIMALIHNKITCLQ